MSSAGRARRASRPSLLRIPALLAPHGFETRDGRLAARLPKPILRLRQVHGNRVHRVDAGTDLAPYLEEAFEQRPAGDALITTMAGVTVAVSTADCVPVLLYDPTVPAVAAAHAGWRGLATGVLPETVARMRDAYDGDPGAMVAAIGPSIGRDAYLVDAAVREPFLDAGLPASVFEEARQPDGSAGWLCDLVAAARAQLVASGLLTAAIHALGRCTLSEPEQFHSYRRDGDASGRMLSGIALPS